MKAAAPMRKRRDGMTLVETLVTLGVLSIVMAGSLLVYSTTLKAIHTRNSQIRIMHDADTIMSYVGNDLRHTYQYLPNYQGKPSQQVVAALKVLKGSAEFPNEQLVVYFLDADTPSRLMRSVISDDYQATPVELSALVRDITIAPAATSAKKLFEIHLSLEDTVAGKSNTLQTSSAFTSRY
jgi:prepilin-type N-terminal cleavage/methylation domain-containing protein